jgi:hypothetical protein
MPENAPMFRPVSERQMIADALGVCVSTLPTESVSSGGNSGHPAASCFIPLTDEEWDAVLTVLPKLPVPKPDADFKDRIFIDAVLWWIAAKAKGYSWHRLPQELGPASSREHRARRWSLLGYWTDIAQKLATDPRISPDRLRAFERIAADAVKRKAMLLERRSRLTDASSRLA